MSSVQCVVPKRETFILCFWNCIFVVLAERRLCTAWTDSTSSLLVKQQVKTEIKIYIYWIYYVFLFKFKSQYKVIELPLTYGLQSLQIQRDSLKLLKRKSTVFVKQTGSCALPAVWTPLQFSLLSLGEVNSKDICQVWDWLGFNRCPPEEDRQGG